VARATNAFQYCIVCLKSITTLAGEPAQEELCSLNEGARVLVPVLRSRRRHQRSLYQSLRLLAGDIGIDAPAQSLQLIVEPQLDAFIIELLMDARPISKLKKT
jgi:5-formyltetrahydrofolate cyclo-ligase